MKFEMRQEIMNRRRFLSRSAAAAGGVAGAVNNVFAAQINALAGAPVVETVDGKIRGRILNKVNAFQGIPYGASTAGAARFMPASKPKPWRRSGHGRMGSGSASGAAYGNPGSRGHDPQAGDQRRLPAPERVDHRLEQERQASGDGMAARRRLHQRQRQLHDVQRR